MAHWGEEKASGEATQIMDVLAEIAKFDNYEITGFCNGLCE